MPRFAALAAAIALAWAVAGCSGERSDAPTIDFREHSKSGSLSLIIIGDYFHGHYVNELEGIVRALSTDGRLIVICPTNLERAVRKVFADAGVAPPRVVALPQSSPVLTQWGRDVAVAGPGGRVVVTPYKHATSAREAEVIVEAIAKALPEHHVELAPFVFEAGNVAFVRSGERLLVIVGRKVLFDNSAYQRRPWAPGHHGDALLDAIAATFGADAVIVVGRAAERPPTRLYFEYHIDMGMTVLRDNTAVVSWLDFGESERGELRAALRARSNVVTPFIEGGDDATQVWELLTDRLRTVAREYEDYASTLDSLGVTVHRMPVDWQHVLASMSWTNVAQAGRQIVMPLYPDSLRGVATGLVEEGGQLRVTVDVSRLDEERFELRGANERGYALYASLGYDVVGVPEYLHYMMGGVHCFVNVIE